VAPFARGGGPGGGGMKRGLASLLLALALTGCASDREVFDFNVALAKNVLGPIGKGYQKLVPKPIRKGLRNMTSNVAYTDVFANNLLQGKLSRAHSDAQRIVLNTVLGVGGIFDVATDWGLPRYEEDFGQTLAVSGIPSGRYLNVPFLGPTTPRALMQYPFRFASSPFTYFDTHGVSTPFGAAGFLLKQLDEVDRFSKIGETVDLYAFVKAAYLDKRQDLIFDGHPPAKAGAQEKDIDEALDDLDNEDLEGLDDLEDLEDLGDPEGPDETAPPKKAPK